MERLTGPRDYLKESLMIEAATLRPGIRRLPDYLTTEEAAAELNYHPEHIRWMIRRGKLQADKKVGVWLISRDALEAYRAAVAGKAKNDPTRVQ